MTHIDGVKLLEWLDASYGKETLPYLYPELKTHIESGALDADNTHIGCFCKYCNPPGAFEANENMIVEAARKVGMLADVESLVVHYADKIPQDFRDKIRQLAEELDESNAKIVSLHHELAEKEAEVERWIVGTREANEDYTRLEQQFNQVIEALEEIASTWSVDHVYRDIANGALQSIRGEHHDHT